MTERMSSFIAASWIKDCEESPALRGSNFHDVLLDLLDARRERDAANKALVWLWDHPMEHGQKYVEVGIVVAAARAVEGADR
jgi:hypothetical protein